jgi:hypothetical protein
LNRHIVVGPDGSVLVGSENGLLGWRAVRVQRLTTKNGLPCDFVISFVQDKERRWRLYTRCGIVSFSDAELQKWWANPDAAILNRVYDAFDGAQPNIGSFNAAASTADGCVWLSNGVVVQMLDPSRIAEPVTAAAASIESVIVDRKEVAGFNNLRIGPHPRELQIDYTSPTFSVPQRVTFRYKLDGYDDSWHDAGPRRWAGDRYRDDAAAAGGRPLRLAGHARARGDRQRAARRPKRSRRRHRDRASRSGRDRVLDVCAPRVVAANPRLAWPFPSFEAAASTNRAWRAARLAYRTHSTRLI